MRALFSVIYLYAIGLGTISAQTAATPMVYSLAESVYTQNFDGLPSSGSFSLAGKGPFNLFASPINATNISGWQILMHSGTNTNAVFAPGTGSSTGNGVYSLGNSGSGERALGSLSSSTGAYAFGVIITNQTDQLLNYFSISFKAEQWRKGGSTNKNNWTFRYKTGTIVHIDQPDMVAEPNLDFSSVVNTSGAGSMNGNLTENQQTVSFIVRGVTWKKGEQLLLRWDDADESGNDDIVGLDNFIFSAGLQSTVPSIVSTSVTNITTQSAEVGGIVNDQFANTTVGIEYDSLPDFPHPKTITPTPSSLILGTGNTTVLATVNNLSSGVMYHFRIKATNQNGTVSSAVKSFTTAIGLPVVQTISASQISNTGAVIAARIVSAGGAAITEKGVVWSTSLQPLLTDNKIIVTNSNTDYLVTLSQLPQGAVLYARAYAINAGGIAYGESLRLITPTLISFFNKVSATKTNSNSVTFSFQTTQAITGLSAANFSVIANSIQDAVITNISLSANTYTVTVYTGTGDGTLGLQFVNDSNLSMPVSNKPLLASGMYLIDKTPPIISRISIPDKPMKIGDTVMAAIFIKQDNDVLTMKTGTIDGFPLLAFTKKNDTLYTCFFVITAGGNNVTALQDVPLHISLADSLGNTSTYQIPIQQPADLIDANRPVITSIQNPQKGMYIAGDTLTFRIRFSEKIIISNGIPSLTLTIGSRSRTAINASGNGTDSLLFTYVIVSGDFDADGIRTAGTISLNNATIKDLAGNTATVSFSNTTGTKDILVDAIIPVITKVTVPVSAEYKTGNVLDFIIDYSKKVFVSTTDSLPSIGIQIGSKIKQALYVNGSASTTLLFRYVIEKEDVDTNGIKINTSLQDSYATIRDAVGNRAATQLNNIGNTAGLRINTPTIQMLSVTHSPDGLYAAKDSLACMVTYNEKVWVSIKNELPSIKITIGTTSRQAKYTEGSGTNTLHFIYSIQPDEEDTDGIKINTAITLNGSSIKDSYGNDAPLLFNNAINTTGVLVNAVAPEIMQLISSSDTLYKAGDSLQVSLLFTEKVFVKQTTDTPYLKLTIGNSIKNVLYKKGTGSSLLSFYYTIQPGDLTKSGITPISPLQTGNSTITDAIGNRAIMNFKTNSAFSKINIDAVTPFFSDMATTQITICENSAPISLSNALAVIDDENNETLQWKIKTNPGAGVLSSTQFTAKSNGKKILPTGIDYIPLRNKNGSDTLFAEISDGINRTEKLIVIVVHPAIQKNSVGQAQLICAEQIPATLSGSSPTGGNGLYQYTWEVSSLADSTKFVTVTSNNKESFVSTNPLFADTWFRRKVQSASCIDTSLPVKITVVKNGLWLGSINNDWHNTANWCLSKLPTSTTDVLITASATHQPIVNDTAVCNRLVLGSKAHLTINGILQLYGYLDGDTASVELKNGSLFMSGNTLQEINGSVLKQNTLQRLIIQNASGVSIQNKLVISGSLVLNSGTLYTNDKLHFMHTAVIAPSAIATGIIGKVFVSHKLPGGKRNFRLLGHPFATSIPLNMIRDSVDISGENGLANGFTTTATNQPSAFWYNSLLGNDSTGIETGWIPFTHTNGLGDNAWKPYSGIRLLARGKPGQGLDGTPAGDGTNGTYLPLATMLTLSEKINHSDLEIRLPKDVYAGYHVVSNPYLANIDLSRITRGSDIGRYYWLWNPLQGKQGGYTSYPFRNKYILPPFGAFITKSNGNNKNSLLFTENSKSIEPADDSIRVTNLDDIFYVELRLETDTIFWDRMILLSMDSARNFYDRNDAEKLMNNDVNFYSIASGQKLLSIDARPVTNETIIPLGIQTDEQRSFRIWVAKSTLPASNTLLLHDKYLNRWMKLETDSIYQFTTMQDSASSGNQRFEISSYPKPIPPSNTVTIQQFGPNPATDKISFRFMASEKGNTTVRLLQLSGKPVKIIELGKQKEAQINISVAEMQTGIYLLELTCGKQIRTQKFIKQ